MIQTVHRQTAEVDDRPGSRARSRDSLATGGGGGVRHGAKPRDGVGATVRKTRPLMSDVSGQNRRRATAAGGSR